MTTPAIPVRVRPLRPKEQQRRYVVEQVSRALGYDWVEGNGDLVENYWDAVEALGYALPDERSAEDYETH
jgi:hypothetical protein